MMKKINPFAAGNPMTFTDAAKIATLTALVTWILSFFVNVSMTAIRADAAALILSAVQTFLASWAGTFITLAGLDQYMQRQKGKPS